MDRKALTKKAKEECLDILSRVWESAKKMDEPPQSTFRRMFWSIWDKTLDVLGPRLLGGIAITLIVPEFMESVPSISDWLNMSFRGLTALVETAEINNSAVLGVPQRIQ